MRLEGLSNQYPVLLLNNPSHQTYLRAGGLSDGLSVSGAENQSLEGS